MNWRKFPCLCKSMHTVKTKIEDCELWKGKSKVLEKGNGWRLNIVETTKYIRRNFYYLSCYGCYYYCTLTYGEKYMFNIINNKIMI